MPIRAVFFDVGGVLESTPPTGWVQLWEAKLGLETGQLIARTSDLTLAGSLGQITEAEVRRRYGERLGIDVRTVDALLEDAWTEYLGTLNEELVAYVRDLRTRCRTGIISNSFVGAREREGERYGFPDLVDAVIYSHEVGFAKPDSRIYEIACERLDVQPAEALLVDDVQRWVDAARRLGLHGVVFRTTSQAIAEIEALLGF
jgi:epoxide hydrolase-like predicted phosphatase